MATYFKMLSSASGSLIAIPLDQLSGRLKKHGIKCEKNPDPFWLNKPGSFSVSGIDGDLTVCLGAGQVCEQFVRVGALPHSVLAAMEKEFNVEFVNEYDPRFWGCASKDELAAIVRKTEQRIDLLDAAQAASREGAPRLEKKGNILPREPNARYR